MRDERPRTKHVVVLWEGVVAAVASLQSSHMRNPLFYWPSATSENDKERLCNDCVVEYWMSLPDRVIRESS